MSKINRYEQYSPGLYGLPHMGEVLADYRKRAGWSSQEAFAIVCGVDKQTVVYWENQEYLADMDRRIFLCRLLRVSPVLLGLTWNSVIEGDKVDAFNDVYDKMTELLETNAYALYEDVLNFAHTSSDKYSTSSAYRFYKHQRELEQIVGKVSEREKDTWKELLSRYYQHSTFVAQHHKEDDQALLYANKAVTLASSLNDNELIGATLYRRARVYFIQNKYDSAKQDIQEALKNVEKARGSLKGNCYLLSAEVNSLYAESDETLRTHCRKWQEQAINLIYKGKVEDDGTFLTFNLYAVHHERAKTLLRFSLFHSSNKELIERLENLQNRANKGLLGDARNALIAARNHLDTVSFTQETYLSITEAKMYLIAREFEESAKAAKRALQFAHKAHSKQCIDDIKNVYTMLYRLMPTNPYICNLGVELGLY